MSYKLLTRIMKELKRRIQVTLHGFPKNFNIEKKNLIDFTFEMGSPTPHSFADLGGVWRTDAAYTFYTLDRFKVESAFLVDLNITDAVLEKSRQYDNLNIIRGNFSKSSVLQQLENVDAIFLFDVLLHQVKPDWGEILQTYSTRTNYFVVFNMQFMKYENSVRLLELGREEYFKNVPHDEDHPTYKALFEKMYEIHPTYKLKWRDIPDVWQWGITDIDLIERMVNLGFTLQYYKNCGQFGRLENFQNHAFVFQKM